MPKDQQPSALVKYPALYNVGYDRPQRSEHMLILPLNDAQEAQTAKPSDGRTQDIAIEATYSDTKAHPHFTHFTKHYLDDLKAVLFRHEQSYIEKSAPWPLVLKMKKILQKLQKRLEGIERGKGGEENVANRSRSSTHSREPPTSAPSPSIHTTAPSEAPVTAIEFGIPAGAVATPSHKQRQADASAVTEPDSDLSKHESGTSKPNITDKTIGNQQPPVSSTIEDGHENERNAEVVNTPGQQDDGDSQIKAKDVQKETSELTNGPISIQDPDDEQSKNPPSISLSSILWDDAYDDLKKHHKEVVKRYETILSGMIRSHNEEDERNGTADGVLTSDSPKT
ncbi:hypothetical protein PT974_00274 [Cladobotryum mycophilum]|uniref:Uncharacterized protein n=1 Tax=Cladobotryum mycophilum TaxID=491253 RepID=A0ABR0T0M1_9HYPO